MFIGHIPGVCGYWGTLWNCFFSTFFSACFQPHELLLLQAEVLAFSVPSFTALSLPSVFDLTACGRHPGKTVTGGSSRTPLRTEVTTLHFFLTQGGGSPRHLEESRVVWLCWKWWWGDQRGWCSHPCRRRLGVLTRLCRNHQRCWCPPMWPCSACLTTLTQEVALFFTHLPFQTSFQPSWLFSHTSTIYSPTLTVSG